MPDHRPSIPAAPIRNGHMPPDNHTPGVVIALFVCLPLGLVALWHSRRVTRCWQACDRKGARRASNTTWAWCVRAFVTPALLFGLIMAYWGWVALKEDFRPYAVDTEIYELLYSRGSADEGCGEDEDCGEGEEGEE